MQPVAALHIGRQFSTSHPRLLCRDMFMQAWHAAKGAHQQQMAQQAQAQLCVHLAAVHKQPLAALCDLGQQMYFTAGHSPKACLYQHSMQQSSSLAASSSAQPALPVQSCMQVLAAQCILSQ